MRRCKQVILIRADLAVPVGRLAAFAAHASIKVFLDKAHISPTHLSFPIYQESEYLWLTEKYTKVCLSVPNSNELTLRFNAAKRAHIPCALHIEREIGEIVSGSIGPAFSEDIDKITGDLKLL